MRPDSAASAAATSSDGERVAGVALGAVGEVVERVVVDREVLVAEATLVVGERTLAGARAGRRRVERLEPEQGRARQQRAGDREERVLGGGADQDEQPLLDVRAAARPAGSG